MLSVLSGRPVSVVVARGVGTRTDARVAHTLQVFERGNCGIWGKLLPFSLELSPPMGKLGKFVTLSNFHHSTLGVHVKVADEVFQVQLVVHHPEVVSLREVEPMAGADPAGEDL